MKKPVWNIRKDKETFPLEGRSPLTLTLSPKGRGDMTFDNTGFPHRRDS
jgi:hypothetical protein